MKWTKDQRSIDVTKHRRRLLQAAGFLLGSAALPKASAACLDDPPETAPLRIDVHCHIFNGRDVNAGEVIMRVSFDLDEHPVLTPTLRLFGLPWLINGLIKISGVIDAKSEGELLDRSLAKGDPQSSRTYLCTEYDDYLAREVDDTYPRRRDVGMEYFRPRVFNAITLARTYPEIDLFTPQMVDLNMGLGFSDVQPYAIQSVQQLVPIMSAIAKATGGRIHPFVAFDPFREVKQRKDTNSPWFALEEAKRAVMDHGFIGVKLYPPMGFAPIDNVKYACPRIDFLPKGENIKPGWDKFRRDYGDQLDEVLHRLYKWCQERHVPILAHANDTMQSNLQCARATHPDGAEPGLGTPRQWAAVLKAYPDLQLCLGHLGGFADDEAKPTDWAKSIAKMMPQYRSLYADVANRYEILKSHGTEAFAQALDQLLRNQPLLGSRLMYGSDWHMLQRKVMHEKYSQVVEGALPADLRRNVMGYNAVSYLGLDAKGDTRGRLEAFYKKNSLPLPRWFRKLPN
jgi:predicted TIM-barrel fold metal-dependent hydrolase